MSVAPRTLLSFLFTNGGVYLNNFCIIYVSLFFQSLDLIAKTFQISLNVARHYIRHIPLDSEMHLLGSHRFMHIYFLQVVMNLIFTSSGKQVTAPVLILLQIIQEMWEEVLPSED